MNKVFSLLLAMTLVAACGGPTTTDGGDATRTDATGDGVVGDAPNTDVPAVDVPTSDAPSGDTPSIDVPTSDVPTTDGSSSDVPAQDSSIDSPLRDAPSTDSSTMDASDASDVSDASMSDMPTSDSPRVDVIGPDAGSCSITGIYRVTVMGMPVYFRFNPDGTWDAATTIAGLSMPAGSGTHTVTAFTFTITDRAGCPAGTIGTYTITWDSACNSFTLRVIADACASRSVSLNGTTFTREPASPSDAGMADSGGDAASDAPTDVRLDAPTDAPLDVPVVDGGACSILGTYSLNFMGMTLYFRFAASGRWVAALALADLDTMPANTGDYTYDAATAVLTFLDDRSCMGSMGRYRVAFTPSCNSATLTLISDGCAARSMVLSGLSFTRL